MVQPIATSVHLLVVLESASSLEKQHDITDYHLHICSLEKGWIGITLEEDAGEDR